jgi:2'-5' RNA ligase
MTDTATETLRCFIAIPLPETVQQRISALQQRLCLAAPELRPTQPENLHLTLHFLGELRHDQLAKIASSMLSIGKKKKNFNATLKDVDLFPNRRKPRIIWLGIQPEAELIDLYDRLSDELIKQKFKPDPRPYRPHLTIGRFKRLPKQTEALCPFLSYSCGSLKIDRMILFSSKLTARGAIHTPLQTADLLGTKH